VNGLSTGAFDASVALLVLGFGYAAWSDWKTREVPDRIWQLLGIGGLVLGWLLLLPEGTLTLALWTLVALFVLQHVVPWDDALTALPDWIPGTLEVGAYLGVGAILLYVAYIDGVGPSGLPGAVAATYLSVLFARGLFEARILYGGADAKALMIAGVLVPLDASPLLSLPANATAVLALYPFAVTLLMDAALCAIAVPIALLARNLSRGDFEFPRAFTGYRIAVRDLPDRFVWLRDPTFQRGTEEEAVETSEEDRALRIRQRDDLLAQGVDRVWVTPQLPFVVLMALGAVLGVLIGNVAFDLFSLL
jgi:hypothetical protein